MSVFANFPATWLDLIDDELEELYLKNILDFVDSEYADSNQVILPPKKDVFNALIMVPPENVSVVVLAQDPYHGIGQANGLAFSYSGLPKTRPPSLKNIFKEIDSDIKPDPMLTVGLSSDLTPWAQSGVLLLNSVLTVRQGLPGSHAKKGWEQFTEAVVLNLADKYKNIVFVSWGKYAQKITAGVNPKKHLVLTAAHPSPLSAHNGFFGCKHFSRANEYLAAHGKKPIDWDLLI